VKAKSKRKNAMCRRQATVEGGSRRGREVNAAPEKMKEGGKNTGLGVRKEVKRMNHDENICMGIQSSTPPSTATK
jgi:hypothetical protein